MLEQPVMFKVTRRQEPRVANLGSSRVESRVQTQNYRLGIRVQSRLELRLVSSLEMVEVCKNLKS